MSTAISVENVSKFYRLGTIGSDTLGADVSRWWAHLRGKPDPLLKVTGEQHERQVGKNFWALDKVSFKLQEGEVLGVVGRNGAGKSTLLKILSQVTAPSDGMITIRGRVASLLEVGTGFHPDLTGRENVFLNGAILGMTRSEIRKKFDEIVAFSECEAFIDTPVKRYSSGMYVRLAFAVAAHLDPEILIIDEVLAVGDAQFQAKCLGKISEVSRGGRTVLFVSHNMIAVRSLCQRVVWLQDGRVFQEGPAVPVVTEYLREASVGQQSRSWAKPDECPGNDVLRLREVSVVPQCTRVDGLIGMDSPIAIETVFSVLNPTLNLHVTYALVNEDGVIVLTTFCESQPRDVGLYRASFVLPGDLLNSGRYRLRFLVVQDGNRVLYDQDGLVYFTVVDTGGREGPRLSKEPGVVRPRIDWTVGPTDSGGV